MLYHLVEKLRLADDTLMGNVQIMAKINLKVGNTVLSHSDRDSKTFYWISLPESKIKIVFHKTFFS